MGAPILGSNSRDQVPSPTHSPLNSNHYVSQEMLQIKTGFWLNSVEKMVDIEGQDITSLANKSVNDIFQFNCYRRLAKIKNEFSPGPDNNMFFNLSFIQ